MLDMGFSQEVVRDAMRQLLKASDTWRVLFDIEDKDWDWIEERMLVTND